MQLGWLQKFLKVIKIVCQNYCSIQKKIFVVSYFIYLKFVLLTGVRYTEKCDVHSWSIVLWEVLSRRKPFQEIGNTFMILWKVHLGGRPPRIQNCPKPIEEIMTRFVWTLFRIKVCIVSENYFIVFLFFFVCIFIRCWDHNPNNRPSMDYVVDYMTKLIGFFGDYDTPIEDLSGLWCCFFTLNEY